MAEPRINVTIAFSPEDYARMETYAGKGRVGPAVRALALRALAEDEEQKRRDAKRGKGRAS